MESPVSLRVVQVEVLASSNDLFLFGMIQTSLKTRDQLLCVLLSVECVFAGCLLTTAPPRIQESVNIS